MRILLAAISAFILSGVYTPLLPQAELSNALTQYRDPVLAFLFLYVLFESALALWKDRRAASLGAEANKSRAPLRQPLTSGHYLRILLAALLACAMVLSSVYPIPSPLDLTPVEETVYRYVALIVLAGYILFESVFGFRKRWAVPLRAEAGKAAAKKPAPKEEIPQYGEALVFLSLLQEKGRFVDFLMEDITAYNDAQVAAASRVVHQGCAAIIREYLDISPVHSGKEGERITINSSSDPNQYRLVGKVLGDPPFSGTVVHRGWKTSKISLPRLSRPVNQSEPHIITPAEVELG